MINQQPAIINNQSIGYLFAAIRAELKFGFHPPAAPATTLNLPIGGGVSQRPADFLRNNATPVTLQETFSLFHPEEGNEEEAQVMIQAFEPSGGMTATRAEPWWVIELYLSGLYASDENESASPPELRLLLASTETVSDFFRQL
jgi:hypothetical protein